MECWNKTELGSIFKIKINLYNFLNLKILAEIVLLIFFNKSYEISY
jgi:hypothetical protein